MVRLHDYGRSSAAYRVRIALNLHGIAFERTLVNLLTGAQRGADNLGVNKQGLVPTLEIDGLVLTQSLAIIEYLDETRGPLLLPSNPAGRARVRALSYAVAMEIAPVGNLSVRKHVEALTSGATKAEDWMRHYIIKGFAALEPMLADGGAGLYCHGDRVTMADVTLVPQVYNANRAGIDRRPIPRSARLQHVWPKCQGWQRRIRTWCPRPEVDFFVEIVTKSAADFAADFSKNPLLGRHEGLPQPHLTPR